MRRRLTLLVAATTTLTLIAFLVPLALLVRDVAEDRATDRATADVQGIVPVVGTADRATIELTVDQLAAIGPTVTVFLPDGGAPVGDPDPRTPAVDLAATGTSLTAALDGGPGDRDRGRPRRGHRGDPHRRTPGRAVMPG